MLALTQKELDASLDFVSSNASLSWKILHEPILQKSILFFLNGSVKGFSRYFCGRKHNLSLFPVMYFIKEKRQ
jgi:hypothetical protein